MTAEDVLFRVAYTVAHYELLFIMCCVKTNLLSLLTQIILAIYKLKSVLKPGLTVFIWYFMVFGLVTIKVDGKTYHLLAQ